MTPASVISSFPGLLAGSDILHAGSAVLELNLCSWFPGTSLIIITGKKTQGWKCLKINPGRSLQLQPWNSESYVKPDSGSLSSWIWASAIPCVWPSRGEGWDLSMPLTFHVHWVWQRWILCFVFPCFLLSSDLNHGGRGKEKGWSSSPKHQPTAMWSGRCCFGVCSGVHWVSLWLLDLSGSKLLSFNTDLFLKCCPYCYASLGYWDKRPVFCRLCDTWIGFWCFGFSPETAAGNKWWIFVTLQALLSQLEQEELLLRLPAAEERRRVVQGNAGCCPVACSPASILSAFLRH